MKRRMFGLSIGLLVILVAAAMTKERSGAQLIEKYGCVQCHSIDKMKQAPPFQMIKKRYLAQFNQDQQQAKQYLMRTIRRGSQGKWCRFDDRSMPSHTTIPRDDLAALADFILSLEDSEQHRCSEGENASQKTGCGRCCQSACGKDGC